MHRFDSIDIVTAPAIEPVSLADIRDHLRYDTTDNDMSLRRALTSARIAFEDQTGRALITQTLDVKFSGFSDQMQLPRPPLQSVTSVSYLDTDGVSQVLSSDTYRVITGGNEPGELLLEYGESWPDVYPLPYSRPITVRIVAGYGDTPDDVNEDIKHAIRLLAGAYDINREDTVGNITVSRIPNGANSIIARYKVYYF